MLRSMGCQITMGAADQLVFLPGLVWIVVLG